jgi:hypothetical protein
VIKVKLNNPASGRNEPTFRPLLFARHLFHEMGIEFVINDTSYDFEFIGLEEYYDMSLPLSDSIDKGLEYLSNITGDYFLFDGFDSTSLMGSYEVFSQSNAKYLFKHQLLKSKDDYKNTSSYGKWWFGEGSELDVSYDIPDHDWSRIKLTGYNLGYLLPDYHNHYPIYTDKSYDICAIYQGHHPPVPMNCVTAPGNQYTTHRTKAWDILNRVGDKYSVLADKLPKPEYLDKLRKSKIAISPYGMGEVCFRDFELMQYGVLMVKPDMSNINTAPGIYINNETYIPCKPDWSDLQEIVEDILGNYQNYSYIIENFRTQFKQKYTLENLCIYWYNIFKNLNDITTYDCT